MHKHPHVPQPLELWEQDQIYQAVVSALSCGRKKGEQEIVNEVLSCLARRLSREQIETEVNRVLNEYPEFKTELRYYL